MSKKLSSTYDAITKSLHPRLREKFGDIIPLPSSLTNEQFIRSISKSFNPNNVFTKKEPDWLGNVPVRYQHTHLGYYEQVGYHGEIPVGLYSFNRTLIFPLSKFLGVAEGQVEDIDDVVGIIGTAICADWVSASLACHASCYGIGFDDNIAENRDFDVKPEFYVMSPCEFKILSGFPEKDGFDFYEIIPLTPVGGLVRLEIVFFRKVSNPEYDQELADEDANNHSFNCTMYDAGMDYLAIPSGGGPSTSPTITERVKLRFKMKPERARDIATKSFAMAEFAQGLNKAFQARKYTEVVNSYGSTGCHDCHQMEVDCWCGYPGPNMQDHSPRGYWNKWSDHIGYGRQET